MKFLMAIFVSCTFSSLVFAGDWVGCASEGQTCRFSGTKQVAYGASGKYFKKTLTNGTACTNQVFGDPAFGQAKECRYYQASWTFCATEGQQCNFDGRKLVKYGSGSQWVQETLSGSVLCNNMVFGDPAYGATKSCLVLR